MKHLLFFFSVFFLLLGKAYGQDYQETIRQYVLEKLVFYYVDNPGAAKPSNLSTIEVDKITISNGQSLSTPLWTNPNNVGLKTMLVKLLCSVSNGGDFRLQQRVANVLLINDKKVYVYLYNDFANAAKHSSWDVYCTSTSYAAAHNNASWPCASMFTNRTLEASGHIGIGSYFYNPARPASSGGWSAEAEKLHVFIHELVHTQLPLILESTLGGVSMYGNGGHAFTELIPSKNSAFNEGIATAFALRYHFPSWMDLTPWLNSNTSLFVDNIGGCGASANPPPHCLRTRLSNASVAPQASCGPGTTCYAIRDIPDDIIMYCENVPANILYQYMDQFSSETMLVRDIKSSYQDMHSEKFTFTALFRKMLLSSKNLRPVGAAAGSTGKGQLLTMAIVDYFSGYKMDNLGALGRIMDTNFETLNHQYVRDYFSMAGRQTLLGYRTNPTTWNIAQQLDRFAITLNVRAAPTAPAPTAPGGRN